MSAPLTISRSLGELTEYERIQREIEALEARKATLTRQATQIDAPRITPSPSSCQVGHAPRARRKPVASKKPRHVPPFIGLKLSPGGEVERRTVLGYTTMKAAIGVAKEEGYDRVYTLRGNCAELGTGQKS